jgi:hypothetical protein
LRRRIIIVVKLTVIIFVLIKENNLKR